MRSWLLFRAQLKKTLIYLKRYYVNSLGQFLIFFVVFVLIFLGYRGFAGGSEMYGTGLSNIITGYLLWMLALVAYSEIAYSLYSEAREGTLEQLYMSPLGYTRITVTNLIASLLAQIFMFGLMVLTMVLVTGQRLNFDLASLLPLFIVFLLPVIGIGFSLGGLQLIFKRVQSILQIIQFALIGAIATPIEFGWTKLLPCTLASELVRRVTVEELSLVELPLAQFWLALGTGLVYLG